MDRGSEQPTSPGSGAAKPIWLLILACAIAETLAKLGAGIKFQLYDIAAVILIVIAALGLWARYTVTRPDDRIARLFRAPSRPGSRDLSELPYVTAAQLLPGFRKCSYLRGIGLV